MAALTSHDNMAASVMVQNTVSSVWDRALSLLDSDLRNSLTSTRTRKRDVLEAVLREIETKRDIAIRKRWKFKTHKGDVVIVRDVLEKIARWIHRFKETGDVLAQYDPAHLSLPWAAFRFLLQIAVSEVQIFGAIIHDLEAIARIVTRYRKFEQLYVTVTQSELESMLVEALTRLYSEILIHLARMVEFFKEKTLVRSFKSPFRTADQEQMHKIMAQEAAVLQMAKLVDADRLITMETAIARLSLQTANYDASLSQQKYREIITWLSVLPYSNYHQFVSQSRISGLGNWLLNHDDYIDWQTSSSSSILLLHGITGSGKSTLCSMVVDFYLSLIRNDSSAAPFGYFYCANPDFEKVNYSHDDIIRSVLGQLALEGVEERKIKDFLRSEYERQITMTRINGLELVKLGVQDSARLILELAEQDPVTIIIDAIDALEDSKRYALVSMLRKIVSEADNVIKILISSRSSDLTKIGPLTDKQIEITSKINRLDMEVFVNHLIDSAVSSKLLLDGNVTLEFRSVLEEALLDGAGEMFLWAKLQFQRLCRERTQDDILIALRNRLPGDLNELYQKTMVHILDAGATARDIAVKALSWILHTREPLTPSALLATVSSDQAPMMRLTQLTTICADLIVFDMNSNVMRFIHQSVKEFLQQHAVFVGTSTHRFLALSCVEACSRGPIHAENLKMSADDFYYYAAMYWPVHYKLAEDAAASQEIASKLSSFIFDEDFETTLAFDLWLKAVREIVTTLASDHAMKICLHAILNESSSCLFLACTFGLSELLELVLKRVGDINTDEKNEQGHTPIYLAAAFGHSTIVSMLVDYRAQIDVRCGKYGSPLHAACFKGHVGVVETLLKLGASISCGVVFDDALQAAYQGGHEAMALHLVENSLIIQSETDYDRALEGASRAGFVRVIERLQRPDFRLFSKSKPDQMTKKTRTAIQGGQLGVIRHSLKEQTDVARALPADAVALATLYNHKALAEFFLEVGMDIEAEGAVGTPLRTACLLNYQPIIRLLLDRGADIDACGAFGNALQAAAMKGHSTAVKLLIAEGANVNLQGGFYGTALQAAASHGQRGTVAILLDADADIYAGGYFKDAFHAAAEGGFQDVMTLILRTGYEAPRGLGFAARQAGGPPPRSYKTPMRDTSPGRSIQPRIQQQRATKASRAVRNTTTSVTGPITELEDILRIAESESEKSQAVAQEASGAKCQAPLSSPQGRDSLQSATSICNQGVMNLLFEISTDICISEKEITEAVTATTSQSHVPIIKLLLDFAAKRQSTDPHIECILEIDCGRQESHLVDLALDWTSEHCPTDEIKTLKEFVTKVMKYHRNSHVSHHTLLWDLAGGCNTGEIRVVDAILRSKHRDMLSYDEIDSALQLCAIHGHTAIIQMLFEYLSLRGKRLRSGAEAFVVAAAKGYLETMKLLVSFWDIGSIISNAAVTRALVVASENGHIDVTRYLVEDLRADVNVMTPDIPIGSELNNIPWTRYAYGFGPFDPEDDLEAFNKNRVAKLEISPLQAALRALAKLDPFETNWDGSRLEGKVKSEKDKTLLYEKIILYLADNGCRLDDKGGQRFYPIQLAARYCTAHIIERFISAGVDINATIEGESALFLAAGRELSAASIVQRFLAEGAIIPQQTEMQWKLLQQALRYFGQEGPAAHIRSTDTPNGQFLEAPSLGYIFSEGSGAVLFELLQRMPQIMVSDLNWILVLQMAACLDNHPFVDLLLSRNIDVSKVGYLYGTALQAAARYGNAVMTQKLLNAGAQINLVAGRRGTALRGALVGGHADVVDILLRNGADTTIGRLDPRDRNGILTTDSETALQLGVRSGNTHIVKALLRHGADAVVDEPETLHPLILASAQGSTASVQELLDANAPVNVRGKPLPYCKRTYAENASPIHAATAAGHLDVVRMLISQGACINESIDGSGTPLSIAASEDRADLVHLLLSAGATVDDSAALCGAIQVGSIEIAEELLLAGSKTHLALAMACRSRLPSMIELLLERTSDGDIAEADIEKAFAVDGLDDGVFRLLLDYARPTMRHFAQACSEGLTASVRVMLESRAINIRQLHEPDDSYPLQIAAFNLHPEVVRLLLAKGADVNCKSTKFGTPLMTALEACAASRLRILESSDAKKAVDMLVLPASELEMPSLPVLATSPFDEPPKVSHSSHDLSKCEEIVRLLARHGANIDDCSRPFGSPLHLACLLGSKIMVELLLDCGADADATAGSFEKPLFAAIQGGHTDIVELLLELEPSVDVAQSKYSSALHRACALGDGLTVRRLLERGFDATVLDREGRTALTISLQTESRGKSWYYRNHGETTSEAILRCANPLRIVSEDILAAVILYCRGAEDMFFSIMDAAKTMTVPETAICHALEHAYNQNDKLVTFLMRRSGDIGVTSAMLKAVKTDHGLRQLLNFNPICNITPDILESTSQLDCMRLLLETFPEAPVTEKVILRAITIKHRDEGRQGYKGLTVLEMLFDRNPEIFATQEMIQKAYFEADKAVLLTHLRPINDISTEEIVAEP